jgi:CheY-like chemotaxis protein
MPPTAPRELTNIPILVVEDDPANLKLFTILLADAGAKVSVARSAEEALRELTAGLPRVLVLDLTLPRMSGIVLLEKLKADPVTRDVVVIAVTSLNGPSVERMLMEAGCAGYVRKPVDTLTFAEIVASKLAARV